MLRIVPFFFFAAAMVAGLGGTSAVTVTAVTLLVVTWLKLVGSEVVVEPSGYGGLVAILDHMKLVEVKANGGHGHAHDACEGGVWWERRGVGGISSSASPVRHL